MLRITIDPGHSKKVNAGVIKGYYEGDAMFTLANYLKEELLKYENTDVALTRGENENPTLSERGSLAVKNGSKVFISLHSNAVSDSESASYICGFYSVNRKASEKLCGELVGAVTNVMEDSTTAWSRGALTKKNTAGYDYYGVLRSSVAGNSPVEYSVLIEHGFHTNKKECKFLMDKSNLKVIAVAEAKVIADYFSLRVKQTPKDTEVKDMYYRVQVGAFSKKENAVAMLQSLKNAGFNGFIVFPQIAEEVTIKTPSKTVEQLAKEVINGDYGSGHATREKNLADAGWLDFYTYEEIRNKVNELC